MLSTRMKVVSMQVASLETSLLSLAERFSTRITHCSPLRRTVWLSTRTSKATLTQTIWTFSNSSVGSSVRPYLTASSLSFTSVSLCTRWWWVTILCSKTFRIWTTSSIRAAYGLWRKTSVILAWLSRSAKTTSAGLKQSTWSRMALTRPWHRRTKSHTWRSCHATRCIKLSRSRSTLSYKASTSWFLRS